MVRWGDMGLFSLEFLDQNLFISSLAVVPIGAALQKSVKEINIGIQRYIIIAPLRTAELSFHVGSHPLTPNHLPYIFSFLIYSLFNQEVS